jgi:hypothetical protein
MGTRKKSAIEVLPPEPEFKSTRKQVVAAKHTVVYEAPEIVEIPIEPDEDIDNQSDAEEEDQRPKPPSMRAKLKQKFEQRGIGGDEILALRIDRLPLYEQNGIAGLKADKEFCGVIQCTEKFFDTDDYIVEVQRRYGPGEYWLTLRHKVAIIKSWRERVGGFPTTPVATASESGQSSQPMYAQPMYAQQMTPAPLPRSVKDEMREVAEIIKLVDGIRGPLREDNPAPSVTDPDTILLSSLATNDKFMDRIGSSLVGKLVGGKGGSGEDDPSPWAVAMELVKTGQAATIVKTVIDSFFSGVSGMIPRTNQNQNGYTQPQGQGMAPQQQTNQAPMQHLPPSQTQPEMEAPQQPSGQQQMTPADQALATVISDCAKKIPPQVTFTNLMTFADALNDQAPAYSIDGWITFFANMPINDALAFVKTLPNGEQVASLPHAKEWTTQLQELIKENEGENDE